jgi:hypothetical protein
MGCVFFRNVPILESGFASFDKMGDYYGVLMNCGEDDYQLVRV